MKRRPDIAPREHEEQIGQDERDLLRRCGYDLLDADKNIQFPRDVREPGGFFVVERLVLTRDGSFYRTQGTIKPLLIGSEG